MKFQVTGECGLKVYWFSCAARPPKNGENGGRWEDGERGRSGDVEKVSPPFAGPSTGVRYQQKICLVDGMTWRLAGGQALLFLLKTRLISGQMTKLKEII